MRYLVVILLLAFGQMSEAVVRWAGPTDLGNSPCATQATPCGLAEAIGVAQAGDDVVLRNGTYANMQIATVRSGTASARITLRAENRHQATIRVPDPPTHRGTAIKINHSYITLRGLVVDGLFKIHSFVELPREVQNTGVIIEDNIFRHSGGVGIIIKMAQNTIVRHNTIDGTGYFSSDPCCGSVFYVGSPARFDDVVHNLEIYGNTIRDGTNNVTDLKGDPASEIANIKVHHNIIENHALPSDHKTDGTGGANDGLFMQWGTTSEVYDNIVRNSKAGSSIFRMYGNGANKALRNVVRNTTNSSVARSIGTLSLAPSEIAFNTYCALSTYNNHSDGTAGINIHDNNANRPQSECDAEVTRILTEMANLPGGGGSTPTPQLQPPVLSFN